MLRPALVVALFSATVSLGCAEKPGAPAPAPSTDKKVEAPQAATASPVKPLDKKQFGAAITEKTIVPLTQLVKEPNKFATQTVRTEGTVTAVCKAMGCWMEIGDETGTAHIKMAGHSFFVPKESSGHRAVVQGKVLGAEEGGACGEEGAKDGCREEAEKETGRVAKIEIEATGIEFVD